ncbi:hypothetical protein FQR65_LT06654 [Abscondita terminalis]|nr:hypothetical protein FQR65_LT06654 [Abscondita terminalis]
MADKETVDKLIEWELSMYIDTFKRHDIDLIALAHLDRSEYLKELVPSWGHQIKLKAKIQEFRNSNEKDTELFNGSNISIFNLETESLVSGTSTPVEEILSTEGDIDITSENLTLVKRPISSHLEKILEYPIDNLPGPSSQTQLCTIATLDSFSINKEADDLQSLLSKTTEGRHIIKEKKLNEKSRQQLCQIIAREILASDAQNSVTCFTYRQWIKQIVEFFPNENSDTYFRTAVINCQKKSLGKLYHCVGNLKKKYRDQGIIASRRSGSSKLSAHSECIRPIPNIVIEAIQSNNVEEVNVEADLEWLRHSTEPINIVLEKWKTTAKERLYRVFSTTGPSTDDYMTEFPCIKKSYAFDLVSIDFEYSFPELTNNLFERFPLIKTKLYDITSKRRINDTLVAAALNLRNEDELKSNFGAFLIIPHLLNVFTLKTPKRKIRLSHAEIRENFICLVPDDHLVIDHIEARRTKKENLQMTLQPYIIAVGRDITNISRYIVLINECQYSFDTIVAAIDMCFKSMWVMNIAYPPEYFSVKAKMSQSVADDAQREAFSFFHAGPVSLNLIEPNFILGNLSAATDISTIMKYKISHILTIDTCPLPRQILELKHLTTKFIQLSDLPKEDLLKYLDETKDFIDDGLKSGVVLVHCYYGVSRSATVVIAYVMQKYQLSYAEAFEMVKNKRSIVFPNQGFVSQLKLYKEMGYKIDKNHMKYKLYRLGMAADKVKQAKILPQDFFDLIKPDPGLIRIQPEPNVYRCKKCRRIVASESNLIIHQDGQSANKVYCNKTYFIEPLSWMNNITQTTQGKLHCPKCGTKLGSFSWIMGCQCPCGCQVAPAFYLTPSKVDWTNVVKNVEVTI